MVDISEVVFLVCMRKRCFYLVSFCSAALVAGPYVALPLRHISNFDNGVLLDESTDTSANISGNTKDKKYCEASSNSI